MRAVRSGEVVEPLPFVEFGFEIDVAFITEELIELRKRCERPMVSDIPLM